MYNVGVFPGKFFPPHLGHLSSIIRAATKVNKLYVVVSDNMELADEVCKKRKIQNIPLKLRAKWLSIELQNIDHIEVIIMDEKGIPAYPEGYKLWAARLIKTVPVPFDVIFGGDVKYRDTYKKSMPDKVYDIFERKDNKYPISATEIRADYLKHWDYIIRSAQVGLLENRHFYSRF